MVVNLYSKLSISRTVKENLFMTKQIPYALEQFKKRGVFFIREQRKMTKTANTHIIFMDEERK
jgi:hypothetical protein